MKISISEFLDKFNNNIIFRKSIIDDLNKLKSQFKKEEINEHKEQIKDLIKEFEKGIDNGNHN